jgi:hypothetical protein
VCRIWQVLTSCTIWHISLVPWCVRLDRFWHPVQSDTFPWSLGVSNLTGSDILYNLTHFPGPLVCRIRQVPLYYSITWSAYKSEGLSSLEDLSYSCLSQSEMTDNRYSVQRHIQKTWKSFIILYCILWNHLKSLLIGGVSNFLWFRGSLKPRK